MPVVVRSKSPDVRQRLDDLCGLPPEVFGTAVRSGHVAMLQCTDNDPPTTPGTQAWSRTVRSLREQVLGPDWRKDDTGNYSLTICDYFGVQIVVASGDAMTGLAHAKPKTRAPKGERTKNVVDANRQGDLFPDSLPTQPKAAAHDTWVLLIYIKAEEVRAELSRPVEMDGDHVSEWSERIILPIGEADPDALEEVPSDFGPDFEPAVKRIA